MEMVGAVLSTVKVALGAAGAELPALSVAVPAGMEMPRVPLPERPLMMIVQMLLLGRHLYAAERDGPGLVQILEDLQSGERAGVEVRIRVGHRVRDRAAFGDGR